MAREKIYENAAARVKAHRERNGLKQITFEVPLDVFNQFEEYLRFKDVTKSQVLTKLICSQILRKR